MLNLNRFYPALLLCYSISLIYLGFFSTQKQFLSIIIPAALAFASFIFILNRVKKSGETRTFLTLIIFIKIALLFCFPHLSDDIYRFWWDGFSNSCGINPYQFSPSELIDQTHIKKMHPELSEYFQYLNSQNYPTSYPLICQLIFRFAAGISGDNLYIFNGVIKIFFLFADIIIIILLKQLLRSLKLPITNIFIFLGNPLCIIELNANIHFEIYLILFAVLSIYLMEKNQFFLSGLSLGLSVVSKLISFIWAPLFLKLPLWKKSNWLFISGLFLPIAYFLLVDLRSTNNYWNSLGLYFKRFEFNSFLFGHIWQFFYKMQWYESQTKISLVLMLVFCIISIITILRIWIKNQVRFSFTSAWIILFAYLMLGTTVHPWYITPLILMSVFCYPITGLCWSFFIVLSYARYDAFFNTFEPGLVLLEYFMVMICFIYEFNKLNHPLKKQQNLN